METKIHQIEADFKSKIENLSLQFAQLINDMNGS